jgi:hypothetical protein
MVSVCGNVSLEYTGDDDDDAHSSGSKSTKIVAEADIGFGNALYIRGAGCGLSWNKGVPMKNKDTKFWVFECAKCKEKGEFEYKLLINDEIWCTGENFVAKCRESNMIAPVF